MLLVHYNTGKENRYRNVCFAILISKLWKFYRANKKRSVIYTLRFVVFLKIQQVKPQKEAVRPRVKQCAEKKSTAKESTSHVKERELDERIQRIKQQNEAILKRAKEIEAEKMKFHS